MSAGVIAAKGNQFHGVGPDLGRADGIPTARPHPGLAPAISASRQSRLNSISRCCVRRIVGQEAARNRQA